MQTFIIALVLTKDIKGKTIFRTIFFLSTLTKSTSLFNSTLFSITILFL